MQLTVEEQARILAHSQDNWTVREIAVQVGRSRSAVHKVIKRGMVVAGTRRRGPKPKLSDSDQRLLLRKARTGNYSCRQLRDQFAPSLSVRRVQQMLSADPILHYVRMRKAPNLTPRHIANRFKWARLQLDRGAAVWRKTVFSDEKRFSLDGPDGLKSYWHDLRTERRWQRKRQNGGGGCMVWGCFSAKGIGKLVFVDNKIDSVRYTEVLQEGLLPFIEEKHPGGAVFQHDGAPSHTSKHTKEWLMDNVVSVMAWPSSSPDMNPIENLWGHLARVVYANGRQYETEEDLRESILHAWDTIPPELLKKLATSMTRRLVELVVKRGGPTRY